MIYLGETVTCCLAVCISLTLLSTDSRDIHLKMHDGGGGSHGGEMGSHVPTAAGHSHTASYTETHTHMHHHDHSHNHHGHDHSHKHNPHHHGDPEQGQEDPPPYAAYIGTYGTMASARQLPERSSSCSCSYCREPQSTVLHAAPLVLFCSMIAIMIFCFYQWTVYRHEQFCREYPPYGWC